MKGCYNITKLIRVRFEVLVGDINTSRGFSALAGTGGASGNTLRGVCSLVVEQSS